MESIGRKLKILRKSKGFTQEDVANRLGLVRTTISNYEIGRRTPHLSELRKFADLYGVSLDYFGFNDHKNASLELMARAKEVFDNQELTQEEKFKVYKEIMRIYLKVSDEVEQ